MDDAILEFRGASVLIGNIGVLSKDDTQRSGGKQGKRGLVALVRILEGLGGALLASGRFMEACATLERLLEVRIYLPFAFKVIFVDSLYRWQNYWGIALQYLIRTTV